MGSQQDCSHDWMCPHVAAGLRGWEGGQMRSWGVFRGLVGGSAKTPFPPSHPWLWSREQRRLGLHILPKALKKPSSCLTEETKVRNRSGPIGNWRYCHKPQLALPWSLPCAVFPLRSSCYKSKVLKTSAQTCLWQQPAASMPSRSTPHRFTRVGGTGARCEDSFPWMKGWA